jgi:hypothetical protein
MSYDCPNTEYSYCHKMGHCKSTCRKLKRKNHGQQGDRAYESFSLPRVYVHLCHLHGVWDNPKAQLPPSPHFLYRLPRKLRWSVLKCPAGGLSTNPESEFLGASPKCCFPEPSQHNLSSDFESCD